MSIRRSKADVLAENPGAQDRGSRPNGQLPPIANPPQLAAMEMKASSKEEEKETRDPSPVVAGAGVGGQDGSTSTRRSGGGVGGSALRPSDTLSGAAQASASAGAGVGSSSSASSASSSGTPSSQQSFRRSSWARIREEVAARRQDHVRTDDSGTGGGGGGSSSGPFGGGGGGGGGGTSSSLLWQNLVKEAGFRHHDDDDGGGGKGKGKGGSRAKPSKRRSKAKKMKLRNLLGLDASERLLPGAQPRNSARVAPDMGSGSGGAGARGAGGAQGGGSNRPNRPGLSLEGAGDVSDSVGVGVGVGVGGGDKSPGDGDSGGGGGGSGLRSLSKRGIARRTSAHISGLVKGARAQFRKRASLESMNEEDFPPSGDGGGDGGGGSESKDGGGGMKRKKKSRPKMGGRLVGNGPKRQTSFGSVAANVTEEVTGDHELLKGVRHGSQHGQVDVARMQRLGKRARMRVQHRYACNHLLILPDSRFKRIWDLCILICLVYVFLVLPVELAFDDMLGGGAWGTFRCVFSLILDVIFISDIVISFRTCYISKQSELVTDWRLIARNYLSRWFWIDLPASIPLDLIFSLFSGSGVSCGGGGGGRGGGGEQTQDATRLIRTASLLKMTRLLRLARIGGKYKSMVVGDFVGYTRLLKYVLFFFAIAHVYGCFYYFASSWQAAENPGLANTLVQQGISKEQLAYRIEGGGGGGGGGEEIGYSVMRAYGYLIYMTLLMFIGDGVGPISDVEVALAIIGLMVGAFVTAMLFAQTALLVSTFHRARTAYLHRVEEVEMHMKSLAINESLRRRILEYYEFQWHLNQWCVLAEPRRAPQRLGVGSRFGRRLLWLLG